MPPVLLELDLEHFGIIPAKVEKYVNDKVTNLLYICESNNSEFSVTHYTANDLNSIFKMEDFIR